MYTYLQYTTYGSDDTTTGPWCGTAERIFSKMNEVLHTNLIPWANCVGVVVDNTSVNLGKSNSIMTRVQQQNPAVYFLGCPCHIVHIRAMKASGSFTAVSHHFLSALLLTVMYKSRSPNLMLKNL